MFNTKEELLMGIMRSLPYPDQIKNLDMSKENSIYFTWRDNQFKVDMDGSVDEVDGDMLKGTDLAMLFRELLKVKGEAS